MARGGQDGPLNTPESPTQRGFAGGEIGAELLGRSDVAKYSSSVALARNMQVERHGAMQNRGGTIQCGSTQNQAAACRLRPFMYDSYDGYLAEFEAGLIRIWALGAPLPVVGAPVWTAANYVANQRGAISELNASNYYYCLLEQWGGGPPVITITGTYTYGGPVTITASGAIFTPDMVYTGAQVRVQIPGGPIVTITLTAYSSSTVVSGATDQALPANLQGVATCAYTITAQYFNVVIAATVTTLTITGTYTAGGAVTLTANEPFFTQEMISQGLSVTFPSASGPIVVLLTSYSSGTVVGGVTQTDVPAALQNTATQFWSTPQTITYQTYSPQGPFDPSGIFQWCGSPGTMTVTATAGWTTGSTVTVTSTSTIFGAGTIGKVLAVHDTIGNVGLILLGTSSSSTVSSGLVAFSAGGQVTTFPVSLQNVTTPNWSLALTAPASGPYWYKQTSVLQVEIPTGMTQAALATLVTSQYNNTMTVTHQSLAPFQITRLGQWQWVLTNVSNQPGIAPPTMPLATVGSGSQLHLFPYVVTSVNAQGVESIPSVPTVCVGNYPSSAAPNYIAWTAVPGAVSYNVYGGSSAPSVGTYQATSILGLLGSTTIPAFNDTSIIADTAVQPPAVIPLFQTTSDYPAVTSYFQSRLLLANSVNHPQRCWASQSQQLLNFMVITPTAASGAIQFDIPGQQIQPITALVDVGKLVLHTASAEYICTGDASGAITPTAINVVRQGTAGGAQVQPAVIGVTDLFVQARGGQVRDLIYTIQSVSYSGKDLTIFAPQMFLQVSVQDMAWQQIRNSVVWCLTSTGLLYGLTYIREHEIWGWHHHDTGGTYVLGLTVPNGNDVMESIAVVPEGQYDTLYLAVHRTINGASVRYIERMATREFQDLTYLSDAVLSDCSVLYNNQNTVSTHLVTATASSWTQGSLITLTASGSGNTPFSAGTVGLQVVLYQLNPQGFIQGYSVNAAGTVLFTGPIRITITGYTSSTVVTGTADQAVPTWAQAALATWGVAHNAFTGATALAGMAVSVQADGVVIASPNNAGGLNGGAQYPAITVSAGGTFSLPAGVCALQLIVGLPVIAQLQTLPLENYQGDTITNKQQLMNEATAMLAYSRGGFWGMDAAHLFEWQGPTPGASLPTQVGQPLLGVPQPLYTGPARIPIQGTWELTGQIFVQQVDPLPLTISAITPTGFTGR